MACSCSTRSARRNCSASDVSNGARSSPSAALHAHAAYELDDNVAFVTDAMTDLAEAHDASIAYRFPTLGELGTTDELLALLAER